MICKHIEETIWLYLYDELSESERSELKNHLDSCQTCHRKFEKSSQLFQILDKTADRDISPRWGYYWSNILNRITGKESRKWLKLPALKWGSALGGFLLCLILGIFIGRMLLVPPQEQTSTSLLRSDKLFQAVLENYFDDLKPLMVDLANSSLSGEQTYPEPRDKEIIESLLIQTQLLRRRFAHRNNLYLNAFLIDIELILIDFNNTRPGDKASFESIQDVINDKSIPLKISLLTQRTKKI